MFKNREKIMARVAEMPKGETSPSGRYWCLTCKMLFSLEEPVCPYMPKVCINSPIPVELVGRNRPSAWKKWACFIQKSRKKY